MKKLLAILLALLMCVCCAEQAETDGALVAGEGEILMHGYINPYMNYYLGVPAEWAIIGTGSTAANVSEASEALEDVDVYGLLKQMTRENDVMIAMSPRNEGVIVTYGSAEGVGNEAVLEAKDDIMNALKQNCSGISFKDDSGKYTYKSMYDILYLDIEYKNTTIHQYYLVTGTQMYVFTFFGTDVAIAETVLSTFSIQ